MKTNLELFIHRNKKRNAKLYDPVAVENFDYIVCPVSKERLSMIKSSYITNVLSMTVEEYDRLYPGVRRVTPRRKLNIKAGLHEVDTNTGLTKYEIGQEKARKLLATVDSTGLSGYDRKGQKTRATHMANVDELGRNGYSQLAAKAIIKGNTTKAKKGLILDPSVRSIFYRYKAVVYYVTNKYKSNLTTGYVTGLAGTPGAYQLDHKFSIMHGYINKVSPLLIGNIANLEMIPWKANLTKHASSSITLEELYMLGNYTATQSLDEFNIILNLILQDDESQSQISTSTVLEKLHETILHRKHRI